MVRWWMALILAAALGPGEALAQDSHQKRMRELWEQLQEPSGPSPSNAPPSDTIGKVFVAQNCNKPFRMLLMTYPNEQTVSVSTWLTNEDFQNKNFTGWSDLDVWSLVKWDLLYYAELLDGSGRVFSGDEDRAEGPDGEIYGFRRANSIHEARLLNYAISFRFTC